MNKFKIPQSTLERTRYKQTVSVELQSKVTCPRCKSEAGYYCETANGYKAPIYHQARFEVFIRTPKKKA